MASEWGEDGALSQGEGVREEKGEGGEGGWGEDAEGRITAVLLCVFPPSTAEEVEPGS